MTIQLLYFILHLKKWATCYIYDIFSVKKYLIGEATAHNIFAVMVHRHYSLVVNVRSDEYGDVK